MPKMSKICQKSKKTEKFYLYVNKLITFLSL